MIGHLLGDFRAFLRFSDILRDPRRLKAVEADSRPQAGIGGTPPDHPVDISLRHRIFCECAGVPLAVRKK